MIQREIIKIPIANSAYAYGVNLDNTLFTVIDIYSSFKGIPVPEILKNKILLTNAVHMDIGKKDYSWISLGKYDVPTDLLKLPTFYMQDTITKTNFHLVKPPLYDQMLKAAKNECIGLERMVVMSPDHLVDRLNNHFFGKKMKWPESLPFWVDSK
ncbi:hypothetical protein [Spongiivirga citrea]|uniref:Uncharacterized protein n=1 Tax=Spongiivirga citrea TaxID=1481457 RepID=A0A6M0CYC8_9FLAO|nr:hypothetical protein [Spongiivirga citrea]NER18710.1 hypothetical protein [Spongiivirga citrea]